MFKNFFTTIRAFTLSAAFFGLFFAFQTAQAASMSLADSILTQNVTCDEFAEHWHGYQNTTNPAAGFESHARIFKYRIYLHDDFMQNVDFNQLWCSSGQGWQTGCAQGNGVTVNTSGGTTIRLVRNDTRPDAEFPNYIEWNFGVNDPYGSPLISDLPGQAGTSIREGLNFVFKDDINAGSATTTAAVWIKFMQYDQSCGARYGESAAQCWQDVQEDEVPGTTGYHWNTETHNIVSNYTCAAPQLICESLDWTGTGLIAGTNGFSVNEVLAAPGPNLTVTARDTAGNDITNDVEFHYSVDGLPGGSYRAGMFGANQGRDFVDADSTVRYDNSQPGDELRVEVVGAESNCFATLTFPYCADLNLTPDGPLLTDGDEALTTRAIASNGQPWPFPITYSSSDPNATFDDIRGPRTLSDSFVDFVTTALSGNITVESTVDPGGQCTDELFFTQTQELTCDELVINNPTPIISLEEMQAGNVEITWTTTGTAAPFGPWTVTSSNPAGTFTDQNGRTSTGTISVTVQRVLYTGNPGDVITVEESSFPNDCFDSIPSELPNDLTCEDLTLTVDFDEASVLDQDTACFNFTLSTSDPAGTLQATVDGGTVAITLADGRTDAGSRAQITTGETTGTLCWENFQAGETITLEVLGQDQCLESYTLPSPNETPLCEDLTLDPNSITINEGDDQSGEETLIVEVTGSDADFEGTLVIEAEGACEISYHDGTGTGDRLTFDVNGSSDTVKAIAENCEEDDSIRAYIQGAEDTCEDDLTVELPICEDTEVEVTYENCKKEDETITLDNICDTDTIDIDTDNNGDVTLTYEDCDNEEHEIDLDICKDQDVELTMDEVCGDDREIRVRLDEEDENLPEGVFKQFIFTFNFLVEKDQYSDNSIFFTHDEDRAFYTLEYTPAGHEDEIEFRDDMWTGSLAGKLGKTDQNSGGTVRLATSYNDLIGGKNEGDRYGAKTILNFGFGEKQEVGTQGIADTVRSKYNQDNFPTFVAYLKNADGGSSYIDSCEANDTILCYDPAFSPSNETHSVKIRNVGQTPSGSSIRIRTVGIVDSKMDCSKPGPDGCKTERFNDRATVQSYPGQIQETTSTLISLCSYLITRNAGDIYLETGLESGMDASCIDPADIVPYRNSDALIFRDGMETDGWVSNLSSYVYEIVDSVGRLISDGGNRTADSVSQSVRNASTNQGDKISFSDWTALESSLTNRNNPTSGVLYFDGSQAESISLGSNEHPFIVPEGAWTLVVENADLILNGDIQYASAGYAKNNIPSIAFVVIGGDIQISRDAHHLVGVYYTNQSFRSKGEIDRSPVNDPLEIQGSVYGYLQPLLDAAKYVGSPSEDGGGIVIRYDNRILINTPPGLSDYVDIQTQQAVN